MPTLLFMQQIQLYLPTMNREQRVRHQIFSLVNLNPQVRKKILILPLQISKILIKFRHFIDDQGVYKTQQIILQFPQNYPNDPPILFDKNIDKINPIFLQSQLIENWNPLTSLQDIILDIYNMLDQYTISQWQFNKNQSLSSKGLYKPTEKKNPIFLECTDDESSETKNLNKNFRTKLKQIYKQVRECLPLNEINTIQQVLQTYQAGFEDIRQILGEQIFRQKVKEQMNNGRFIHKIMTCNLGIKSKKLMIKYYHVMLAAVNCPQNFTCWKTVTCKDQDSEISHSVASSQIQLNSSPNPYQDQPISLDFHKKTPENSSNSFQNNV